jgi:hypothetical protein
MCAEWRSMTTGRFARNPLFEYEMAARPGDVN